MPDKITDYDMPDGMDAQPEVGDIAEQFQAVMVDVEPREVMPPAMDDRGMLASIERDFRSMRRDIRVDDVQRDAVADQERADDAVAMAETRLEERTKEDVEQLSSGFDSDFGGK